MSYSQPLINQPKILLLSIGVGVLLGAFYVIIQSVMRLLGDGRLSYYIADGLFCIAFTLVSFFFMVLYNEGRVRLHLVAGEAFGFFVFYIAAGKYIYSVLAGGVRLVRRALLLFLKPYAFIGRSFVSGLKAFVKNAGEKISLLNIKRNGAKEKAEKKRKKFNLFSKSPLKNPDKSV